MNPDFRNQLAPYTVPTRGRGLRIKARRTSSVSAAIVLTIAASAASASDVAARAIYSCEPADCLSGPIMRAAVADVPSTLETSGAQDRVAADLAKGVTFASVVSRILPVDEAMDQRVGEELARRSLARPSRRLARK